MKRFAKHSYIILWVLTCLVIVPTMLIINGCKEETTPKLEDEPDRLPSSIVTTPIPTAPSGDSTTVPTTTLPPTPTQPINTGSSLNVPDKNETIAFPKTLFIGDSRTVGLRDYVSIPEAVFFCDVGLSSNNVTTKAIKVPGVSDSIKLADLLTQREFDTVYIMLGINEIGGTLTAIAAKYQGIIDLVLEKRPNAIVIVQSTLHVTAAKNASEVNKGGYFTNARIDKLNSYLQQLTNGVNVQYLDMNPMFDDANGCMHADAAAGDGIHIKAKYYLIWRKYLDTYRLQTTA